MEKEKIIKPEISIIIPCFAHQKYVLSTLKDVDSYMNSYNPNYEVIFANDGSNDNSLEIAQNYSLINPKVKVFDFPHRGKAAAVLDGFKKSSGKYILFCDVDLATPINELKKLMYYVTEGAYDIAVASREGIGAQRIGEPYYRHFMGRVFNKITQILLFKGIEDTQCGFKLFTRKALENIVNKMSVYNLEKMQTIKKAEVSAFDVEILFLAKLLKYKVKSIPVVWTFGEKSTVDPLHDSIKNFKDVLKVYINNRKGLYK
ncbi:glycosyltransferase [Patescibacteria group bacterium]|nr:glycosyltransferase [Patescibacteria group bacterium]